MGTDSTLAISELRDRIVNLQPFVYFQTNEVSDDAEIAQTLLSELLSASLPIIGATEIEGLYYRQPPLRRVVMPILLASLEHQRVIQLKFFVNGVNANKQYERLPSTIVSSC